MAFDFLFCASSVTLYAQSTDSSLQKDLSWWAQRLTLTANSLGGHGHHDASECEAVLRHVD